MCCRVRLFDYDAVRALYDTCVVEPVATVTDVKRKSKSKWRPVALDTVVSLLASRSRESVNESSDRFDQESVILGDRLFPLTWLRLPNIARN